MTHRGAFVSETPGGVALEVTVLPRASKSGFVSVVEGRLKVRVAAPPVDGEANEELVRFVARFFDLPRSAVTVARGHRGKRKQLHLAGISPEAVLAALNRQGVGEGAGGAQVS